MGNDQVRFPHVLFLHAMRSTLEEAWQPRADVYRMEDGWLIRLELAGVCPEDVRLSMRGSALVVEGCRRDECLREGLSCHRLEISYSRFERVLELPDVPGNVEIAASYLDGMLTVRIRRGAVGDGGSLHDDG